MMKGGVEVIAVGDELLEGKFVESNTSFISARLSRAGVRPRRIEILPDDKEILSVEFRAAAERSKYLIVTGGLGPTVDDVTKESLIEAFGLDVETRPEITAEIVKRLKRVGRKMPGSYGEQAVVPVGSVVLPNRIGLAVGLRVDLDDFHIFLLPGVPAEMKQMFEDSVLPAIAGGPGSRTVRVRTMGMTETELEERLKEAVPREAFDDLSIISSPRSVDVYLPPSFSDSDIVDRVLRRLGSYVYTVGDESLEEVVVDMLISSGKSIATAESVTGGLVASTIVDVPGASGTLLEGFVTYSNEAKKRELGVSEESLARFGAVSEAVCIEMAVGARQRAHADFALSTTGIAGPSGGSAEKPVGLCYLGLASGSGVYCRRAVFPQDRRMARGLAVYYLLDMLRLDLAGERSRLKAFERA